MSALLALVETLPSLYIINGCSWIESKFFAFLETEKSRYTFCKRSGFDGEEVCQAFEAWCNQMSAKGVLQQHTRT